MPLAPKKIAGVSEIVEKQDFQCGLSGRDLPAR